MTRAFRRSNRSTGAICPFGSLLDPVPHRETGGARYPPALAWREPPNSAAHARQLPALGSTGMVPPRVLAAYPANRTMPRVLWTWSNTTVTPPNLPRTNHSS